MLSVKGGWQIMLLKFGLPEVKMQYKVGLPGDWMGRMCYRAVFFFLFFFFSQSESTP